MAFDWKKIAEDTWNGILDFGKKYGVPLFGAVYLIKEIGIPVIKLAVEVVFGIVL